MIIRRAEHLRHCRNDMTVFLVILSLHTVATLFFHFLHAPEAEKHLTCCPFLFVSTHKKCLVPNLAHLPNFKTSYLICYKRKTFSNPLAIREINFHYVISEALEDQIHFSFRLHNSFFLSRSAC